MRELCIFYDLKYNEFLDEEGYRIENIFELITPSDLLLHRLGIGFDVFRVQKTKHICSNDLYVRIENIPEKEICGYLPRR